MAFKRKYYKILEKRVSEKRKIIQVIIGPRQVGKSTTVQQVIADYKYPSIYLNADAIPVTNNFWIDQQWEAARLKLKTSGAKELLLAIDEIQKIDNWSESVKKLWDEDNYNKVKIKAVLLGSSTLLIQKGLTESLAGRFELIYMTHWSFKEMHEAFGFNLKQFIWFGGYPGSASLINDERRWKDYIVSSLAETTISKDILMMNRVDKPAL